MVNTLPPSCTSGLPLLALALMHGDLRALLSDYRVYARIFIAIPVLMLGQITMDSHFREMSQHFLDANLVRVGDLPLFRRVMEKARRLRDANSPEILIILAVYLQIAYFLQSGKLHYASWTVQAESNTPTLAGYYALFVSHALFLGLLALALWKWAIWIVVLWDLSHLDLQLDSTDGDLTAGLGFLGEVPKAFVPLVLALSAVIGATWRSQVLDGGAALGSFKLTAPGRLRTPGWLPHDRRPRRGDVWRHVPQLPKPRTHAGIARDPYSLLVDRA